LHFTASSPIESVLKTEYCSQVFNSTWTNFKVTSTFKNATHLNRKRNNSLSEAFSMIGNQGYAIQLLHQNTSWVPSVTAVWTQQLGGQFGKDNRNHQS